MSGLSATKPTLLLVDDEERVLRALRMLFRGEFRVLTTTDGREALRLVAAEPVHVVVSDQRMPIMAGVDLLREVCRLSPNTMRLLLTGYSDLAAVVGSVNEGEIYRFLQKPWEAEHIRAAVREAAEVAAAGFAEAEAPPAVDVPADRVRVLLLDSSPEVRDFVRLAMPDPNELLWARSMDGALALMDQHPVGVLISEAVDQGCSHVGAIKALKQTHPHTVTILLTHMRDYEMLVGLINQGQVYRFHPKPGHAGTLGKNIRSALERHRLLVARPAVQARHQVERSNRPLLTGLSDRVMGYFRRLGVS